jgi:hypothetical protein
MNKKYAKKSHNDRNRRNNQKLRPRPNNSGGIPDNTGFQKIKLDEKQAKQARREKRQEKLDSRGPCCKDPAAMKAKNEQMLSELNSMNKRHFLKSVGSVWVHVPIVPKRFKDNNRRHMPHFRQYVKAMNLPYQFGRRYNDGILDSFES